MLPRLIPPEVRAHVLQLLQDAATPKASWMTGCAPSDTRLARLMERFKFPESVSETSKASYDSLVDALLTGAVDSVPRGIESRFPTFERLARDSPCSMRVPTKIRMENMFERCGIALLLERNLSHALTAAALDGTLNCLHFPGDESYTSGQRVRPDSILEVTSTPLACAVEETVSRFLSEPGNKELVRLLSGLWPYGRCKNPQRSELWEFDALMNLFCAYVKDGSILYRLERSHALHGPQSSARSASQFDRLPASSLPLCTFQHLARFGESSDLLVVGHHEGRSRWCAHGDSSRFGTFTAKLGQGAYATVAGYINLNTNPNRYAVRFQRVSLLTRSMEVTEEPALNRFLSGTAGTHIAAALTRLVSPYDGYIDGDGDVHGASIARLYDHQLVVGSIADMVPELFPKGCAEDAPHAWQIDVYEQLVGVSVNDATHTQGVARTDHDFYASLVAQVLCCVRSFASRARFSHCDLTLSNILLCRPALGRTALLYRGHGPDGGGDLYIPLALTSGLVAKVIDYSLACATTPQNGPIFSPDSGMLSCQGFNPELDMHVFACRLLYKISYVLRAPLAGERGYALPGRSEQWILDALGGVTGATLRMLGDMLIRPENISGGGGGGGGSGGSSAAEGAKQLPEQLVQATIWNEERGNHTVKVVRSAVASALRRHLTALHEVLGVFATAIDVCGRTSAAAAALSVDLDRRLTWPPNANDMGKRLRTDAINAAYAAYYCTFSTNEDAIDAFLRTRHFDQFREAIREGLLVMNEQVPA